MKNNEVLDYFDSLIASDSRAQKEEKELAPLMSYINDYEHLKGLSQKNQQQIAEDLETTQSVISRFENLKSKPRYDRLRKLSESVGGSLFITPMGDYSVTVPYDLQQKVHDLAEKKDQSVKELLSDCIRNQIEQECYRYSFYSLRDRIVLDEKVERSTNSAEIPEAVYTQSPIKRKLA